MTARPRSKGYDYGSLARIGVATPQANPTVEAEFAVLFPRTVSLQASRLTSKSPIPKIRLGAYIDNLEWTLDTYGGMPLDAFGFACTGSSYLVGAEYEDQHVERLIRHAGYPVETAGRAILAWLNAREIKKIGIAMPYPDHLIAAALTYWESRGISVVRVHKLETHSSDTTSIYDLTSADAARGLSALDTTGCDAVLLSGTGMPTLACLEKPTLDIPVISSNYCLAWQLLKLAGADTALTDDGLNIRGWPARYAEAVA